MNKEDGIFLRRQLLDWRDKHIENIHHHLNREISLLFDELDNEIDKMGLTDIYSSEDYTKKHLEPIYLRWIENEVSRLLSTAQSELNPINRHALEYQKYDNSLKHKEGINSIQNTATALLSTGAGIAIIPTVVSMSTATVSAGGFLGLLGVTTAVVSLPVALAGVAVVGGLLAFGGNKVANIKSNAINQYKKTVRKFIQELIIYNKAKNSICQRLQAQIAEVTRALLSEITI
jgi:hypothetical protein